MTLNSFETVLVVCIFIIPGFITDGVIKLFITRSNRSATIQLLYFLFYSILNIAILSWLYLIIWSKFQSKTSELLGCLAGVSFGSSIILGIIIGVFKKYELLSRLMKKAKFNINHGTPTAWDYFFSKAIPCYVMVDLIDGSTVYGLYDLSSYCANSEDGQDIYLQEIYDVDDNGNWTRIPTNMGMYIMGNQIKTVKFFKGEKK